MALSIPPPFADELLTYLASISEGRFTYPGNLYQSRLQRSINGVFGKESSSPPPSEYGSLEEHVMDFWSANADPDEAQADVFAIYRLLHRREFFELPSSHVYFCKALGQPTDEDFDVEDRKLYKLTMMFTTACFIS